jgi:two-component system, chemotaxis family, CheB/CheR fusion protein
MGESNFLTVGIGASAGGIQALKRFFERVPADSGAAYVVVLHLSPDHDSQLAEVLQVSAAIPVTQVQSGVHVDPNHVYVVPPDRTLALHDGLLTLAEVTRVEERRAPVDMFFRTLAEARGSRAACVILSGTGANGSMGLKRIKEQGGICLVQDPDEAEHADMPRHAIATALVDAVLPVADMPAKIIAYQQSLHAVRVPETAAGAEPADEQALRDIFGQLRSRTGQDFTNYKRGTMLRRIARRMSLHGCLDLTSYAGFLREHPEEARGLLKDLLISVTNFFRDREAFDVLEQRIVPRLFENKTDTDQIRVWVAGCATGEEAYSLAMIIAERAESTPGSPAVQIFATDVDEAAIAAAREGVYSLNDAADVPPDRLQRFFAKQREVYRIRKELRELILFARHNLIKDPPFSHLDLISCRNLLIYLNRTAQRRAMEVMQFALKPAGFLFLGQSESIEGAADLFAPVEKEAHVFQSRGSAGRLIPLIPDLAVASRAGHRDEDRYAALSRHAGETGSLVGLHRRLLEQYAAPSVIVNEDYEIVHLSERAGRYLLYPGGAPSHNLLKAVRPELRPELRTALYQAAQQRTGVDTQVLTMQLGDQTVRLDILVRPVLQDGDGAQGFFLVLFREATDAGLAPEADTATPITNDPASQLEDELQHLKGQLRSSIEHRETQAEELKASNEELQAMNEELRSSTEELETGKEELQSVNEELRTVNQELKIKIEEQAQAAADLQNLIFSTEIGTIFVDRGARIKLFTPRARDIFSLVPADRGRPLSDISSSLVGIELHHHIEDVLERLERIEREVTTRDDRWYLMRMLPYRTVEDRIDGVIMTFVEITARKRAEDELRRSEERLRLLVDSVADYAIFSIDLEGRVDSWNSGAARVFGYTEAEAIGQHTGAMFTPEDRETGAPEAELGKAREQGIAADERWHVRKDGSRFYASSAVTPLRDRGGQLVGFVKIAHDLTQRKRWEDSLQQARRDLEARVQERTRELEDANRALDAELHERSQVEERIRGLLRRLITIQEDERRRIARDLHDQIGQELAGLSMRLDALHHMTPGDPQALRRAVDELRQIIGRLDDDIDFFAWELRPASLDDVGLATSLGRFAREWSRRFGIAAEFHGQGLHDTRLSREVETNLYRITQEALNNTHKHARASRVSILLERRNTDAVLIIDDDGVGFEIDEQAATAGRERGLGLLGMRERAAVIGGTLEIESHPGRGTSVFVRVPLRVAEGASAES